MAEMIIVGAFTLGGFFLGSIVTLLGVISARPPVVKPTVGGEVKKHIDNMPRIDNQKDPLP